jgi:hypothetical protein
VLAAAGARAEPRWDASGADKAVVELRSGGLGDFCAKPPPVVLLHDAQRLCPLATRAPGCEPLAAACARLDAPEPFGKWNLGWLGEALAVFARTTMWFLVVTVPLFILWLVATATYRARRDARSSVEKERAAVVTPDAPREALAPATDADRLLAMAHDAARTDPSRAAVLYLAAALAALDRRGAIRLAKDRTNGEYVRACRDEVARAELRAIVGEVDRAQFGGESPSAERLSRVAARAASLVRAAALPLAMALALLGCDAGAAAGRAATPEGDDLLLALLEKQGAHVGRPNRSLATLPMPTAADSPLLIVDAERTVLEADTKLHLVRWVRAGGRLMLVGGVSGWPEELGASMRAATSREIKVRFPAGDDDPDDAVDDDGFAVYSAYVARPAGLVWKKPGETFAVDGDGVAQGGMVAVGAGLVVGMASDDPFTNIGLASPPNARAVVALVARYAQDRDILVATPLDGVSPPAGPIAALVRAGLGLATAHAAAGAGLLLLAFGVRLSRPRTTPPPARRAWTEHVVATGTLYARAKVASHALATYARFVDGRLRARMPRGASDVAAFLALRSGEDAAYCAEVWARATSARAGDRVQGDELATLGDLRALYAAAMKTE